MGTGDIGVPTLSALMESPAHSVVGIITQPDKPSGRHQELTPSPIKRLATSNFRPLFQPATLRDPAALEQIRFLRPEVIVVMAYGQILPREILHLPHVACLNLHASLLPKHRGAAPIQAAIRSGDSQSGITVMYMSEGLDTGDILLKKAISVRRRETGGSLHERLADLGPECILEALSLLKSGNAPRIPQNNEEASYAQKLNRQAALINWTWSREAVEAHVRAMNPWPGAWTRIPTNSTGDGEFRSLKVFSTIRSRQSSSTPGEILRHDRHGILVSCGQGGILLRYVQLEGKKRLSPAEFFSGHQLRAGTILPSVS